MNMFKMLVSFTDEKQLMKKFAWAVTLGAAKSGSKELFE